MGPPVPTRVGYPPVVGVLGAAALPHPSVRSLRATDRHSGGGGGGGGPDLHSAGPGFAVGRSVTQGVSGRWPRLVPPAVPLAPGLRPPSRGRPSRTPTLSEPASAQTQPRCPPRFTPRPVGKVERRRPPSPGEEGPSCPPATSLAPGWSVAFETPGL